MQAGCSGHPCPDNTNLVNTLYQRHQTLLQQQSEQQQRQQQQQQQQPQLQPKQFANAETAQIGLEQPADLVDQAAHAPTHVKISDSPTFQGDTVPDTPVAAAEAAAQEADAEPAAKAAQNASQGFEKHRGVVGVDVSGVDTLLDLETGLGSRQSSPASEAAVIDTSLVPDSAKAFNQHQVTQS